MLNYDRPSIDMQNSRIKMWITDETAVWSNYYLEFVQNMWRLRNRQLVRTKENRFGFTGPRVKVGDVICVFNGAPEVHILRRVEDSSDSVERWRLVADAFVHGLVHGEADEMDVEERDIVLV
jgi:hypothetical protein